MLRRIGWTAAFGLLLGGAFSQVAGPPSIADILRSTPQRLTVDDLPASIRGVVIGGGSGDLRMLMGMYGMAESGTSTTGAKMLSRLMETILVDPDEFQALIEGKTARIRGYTLDLPATMMRMGQDRETPDPVFTETWIEANKVLQWTPEPDINRDSLAAAFSRAARDAVPERRTRTVANAKQVGLAILLYSNDYDDVLPNAGSTDQAQKELQPYLRNTVVWKTENPNGGRLLYNTALSGVASSSIPKPASTPAVYEEKSWPSGGRVCAFVDGHAKFNEAQEWSEVWAAELKRRAEGRQSHKGAAKAKHGHKRS